MLFNDPKFFIFLIIVFILLLIGNNKYKKKVFLLSSYLFYSFWDWRFLFLLLLSTLIDFLIGKKIYESSNPKTRKKLMIFSIVFNLGILSFFKYFNFFIDSFYDFLFIDKTQSKILFNIILPVGISFYTFQTMSYTIDIYRKQIKPSRSILDFSIFVSFFPQLVAGPIERARSLLPQIKNFNGINRNNIKHGFNLIFIGYVKKVLISDNIGPIIDPFFENYLNFSSFELLFGLTLFAFQIYLDFSGYSSIARGIAKILGINLMINFNQPYFSTNPSEFWSRWHISLSSWLRDYLYIPLGGNRKNKFRTNINLMTTMLLGGLWHGASWNFVFWGFLHGTYLIIYKYFKKPYYLNNRFISFIKSIIFFILVVLTWLPFRTQNFMETKNILFIICQFKGGLGLETFFILIFVALVIILIDLPAYILKDHCYILRLPKIIKHLIYTVGIILIIFALMLNGNEPRPFIYFQF